MTLLPFLLLAVSAVPLSQDMSGPVRTEEYRAPDFSSPIELAQMTIEQRVIIRVPMMRRGMPPPDDRDERYRTEPPPPPPMEWEERKGPRCIRVSQLRAAAITSSRGVDLMLSDHSRLRARLGRECRAADLYSGFYIQPHGDGSLCAGRDRVLARSGADCAITDLMRLKPRH